MNWTYADLQQLEYRKSSDSVWVFDESTQQLTHLSLRGNKSLREIRFEAPQPRLRYLDASDCRLERLHFAQPCEHLRALYLQHNQLKQLELPARFLLALELLDLSHNKELRELQIRGELPRLLYLYLYQCDLRDLSGLASYFLREEFDFSVEGNGHIEVPPPEIVRRGKQAIKDWLKAAKKKLNEVKIILIGDPKAGKTSLLRRLKDDDFNEEETQTDGINIERIAFGTHATFEHIQSLGDITGYFWDFGGQEIMSSTHQLFLTKRSVYVLLLDARKEKDVSMQITDWVRQIKTKGGNSPIIVVANQIDVNPGFGFANETDLKKEFPQIKKFVKISCKKNTGIEDLKKHLAEVIPQAELFHTEIDERWFPVKEKLQEQTKDKAFLDERTFRKYCAEEGNLSDRREQEDLISFLHDLGIVLHFDKLHTAEYFVLDPYWITYGLYQILTSERAAKQKGTVRMDELDYIINEEEDKKEAYKVRDFKKINYTTNERKFLVDVLHQFNLCFYTSDREAFVIPDLLDTQEPEEVAREFSDEKNQMQFFYVYSYLPSFILPKIMVKTHRLLMYKWRTGCVLQYQSYKALIKTYNNQLIVRVRGEGNEKRGFVAVLRHLIEEINDELPEKPNLRIPLPDTNPPQDVDYEELIEREKDGEKTYRLFKPQKKKYEIAVLLGGMPKTTEVEAAKLDRFLEGVDELKKDVYETKRNTEKLLIGQKEQYEKIVQFIETALQVKDDLDEERKEEIKAGLRKLREEGRAVEAKFKIAIPLLKLLGVDVGVEAKTDLKKLFKVVKNYAIRHRIRW